jgi:hypothetical protein
MRVREEVISREIGKNGQVKPALFITVRREIVESRGETGKRSHKGPRRT